MLRSPRNIKRRAALVALFVGAFVVAASATADAPTPLYPNDPGYSIGEYGLSQVNLPYAWGLTIGKSSIKVAVIDSGLSPDPDFEGKVVAVYNAVNGNTDVSDANFGHGTEMASIIGAGLNNSIGVSGVCGGCQLLICKDVDADTSSDLSVTLPNCINWSVVNGASVINISEWNGYSLPSANAAIAQAVALGVTVVISAGNGPHNNHAGTNDPSANPLASDNQEAIRVAELNNSESNYGSWVDVAAPGNVAAIGPKQFPGGTSAAAAVVSGIVGLMKSCNPGLPPDQVKALLMSTSDKVTGVDVVAGGKVNAYAAVTAAGCQSPSSAPPPKLKIRFKVVIQGAGSVSARPGSMICASRCSVVYSQDSAFRLTAKPRPGWQFGHWSTDRELCKTAKPVCRITAEYDSAITATFIKKK